MSLIPIARADCPLGVPLPWSVYDQDGNILLEQGRKIEDEAQLSGLLEAGALRELSWDTPADAARLSDNEVAGKDAGDFMSDASAPEFSFNDMRLRIGDRIQIQPPATIGQDRYVVKLIGYLDNTGLLVTAPMDNGLRVPLREKDKIVARIFSSQKAFGFSSRIERVCKIPFDYLHLSFPERIQGSVIRNAPRVRTNIIASIALPDGGGSDERLSGLIVNLSADGALVKARQPLCAKGQTVQLAFRVHLHNLDAYLTVKATICSIFDDEAKAGSAPMVNHGVQFQKLPPNDSVILQSMIYQQMIEQPHSVT